MCEYGNYLAIACKPKYQGKSVVFLWDRDSSLTTLSESVDFGLGDLQIIEQVEGELIGISLRTDVAGGTSRMVFRRYSGGSATVFLELLVSQNGTGLQLVSGQKFNANRLYFLGGIMIDGVLHNGVWGIGKNSAGRWIVWLDKLPNNDTAVAGGSLKGFFMLGDFTFISYEDSGYKLTQTSTLTTAYAGSSLIETVIYDSGDASVEKDLVGVTVTYHPLPADGQVILKYKKDAESAWTTIFTDTTDSAISHPAINIESTGASFGQHKEIQFRLESLGGAEITGLSFKTETTGKRLYE